ncbi:MAG: acyltransferase [Faecalicatena sp.]|uniref:acyltransferase family protein n=1 Tax=Faecalicatena sp. TaxID=2005360 RepID=UPI00258339D1|nr:acyltransferase [Faecalicatena sp.]MCI6465883.1 acyltransferase [Faecalicatena sp.]MDY5618701.1 acyltransferase [Lachnospiraceae bacterium]
MNKVKNHEITWKILSTYRSQIMGVAIIWIMLLHGMEAYPQIYKEFPLIGFVMERGMIGVEMFLFVSGMGMFFSFTKNDNIKYFYFKRIDRVLIPYLLISLPFWIWKDLWTGRDVGAFFKDYTMLSFWTEGVYTVWYIALILLLYAVYPLIFNVFIKGSSMLKKGIIMLASLLLPVMVFLISPSIFEKTEIAVWRITSFILGTLMAKWVMDSKKIKFSHLFILAGGTVVFTVVAFVINATVKFPGIVRLIYLPLGLICCLLVGVLLDLLKCGWMNRFLGIAGKYSLELYMIHIFIRAVYRYYVPDSEKLPAAQAVVVWLVIMLLSAVISTAVHKALEGVSICRHLKSKK